MEVQKVSANCCIISGIPAGKFKDGTKHGAGEMLQSYSSAIAFRDDNGETFLAIGKWNYSKTTAKHRGFFLNETSYDTKKRLKRESINLSKWRSVMICYICDKNKAVSRLSLSNGHATFNIPVCDNCTPDDMPETVRTKHIRRIKDYLHKYASSREVLQVLTTIRSK